MNIWISLLVAGLAGTTVMTLFLLTPRWMGWAKVDVIRAGGALVVGGLNRAAFPVGLTVHITLGIVFAFIYAAFLHMSALPLNALTGLLMGSVHGVVVMLLVSVLIMEHHPVAQYHERGPATGIAQLAAHMLYGLTVGTVAALLSQKL
jgi:hypothetical protein